MEKAAVKAVLTEASEIISDLPQHLQEKAFEFAVGALVGVPTSAKPAAAHQASHTRTQRHTHDGDAPDVSDLLKNCKRNPDRYIIFMHDLEVKNEPATSPAIEERFAAYKEDRPKKITRDLSNMAADDLVEANSKARGAAWSLKRKGRERYKELVQELNG